MDMENSKDLWRHRIFREVASFIHEPDAARRARLMLFINSYVYFQDIDTNPQPKSGPRPQSEGQ
ncbi:MAG: hypothetical protein FD165_506 [Gammaproteobacteria bacterium]|nr:MAG: hypothetical protein FD165_506 [Gammaproteobacteria bacterium]TND02232.1 MAG: hypothetical protein FD120_2396 [Gammaproteobacteria bacterium]